MKEMDGESKIRNGSIYRGLWLDGCVSFSNSNMNRGQLFNEVARSRLSWLVAQT